MMEDTTETLLTIREMCNTYEVTARTLRFYESKELIFPIRKGQKRLFTRRDQARMKLILRGKKFGFSLEKIRQLLDLYDTEGGKEAQIRAAVAAAQGRVEEMKSLRAELEKTISELESQISCGNEALAEMKTK